MKEHETQVTKNPKVTDRILNQIKAIIEMPNCPNMFDARVVQRIAHDNKFYELAVFIEEHKSEYGDFIATGIRG